MTAPAIDAHGVRISVIDRDRAREILFGRGAQLPPGIRDI